MITPKTWRCPSLWNFFGLDHNYQKHLYEQAFALKYHGNWSFIEIYNLPVKLRNWFTERLNQQKEYEHEQIEKARGKGASSGKQTHTLS